MKTLKGRYIPHNPQKYRGDLSKIKYRSSWELKYFKWCDYTDIVLQWSSEEHIIPYRSPIDGKIHHYYPDVYLKIKTNNGIEEWIVEIKPSIQTKEPRIQKRMTRKYINEVKTYAVNQYKWEAAVEWCKDRKYKFIVLTEKELGIK